MEQNELEGLRILILRVSVEHFADPDVKDFHFGAPLADGTVPITYRGCGKSYPRTTFVSDEVIAWCRRYAAGEVD